MMVLIEAVEGGKSVLYVCTRWACRMNRLMGESISRYYKGISRITTAVDAQSAESRVISIHNEPIGVGKHFFYLSRTVISWDTFS